MVHPALFFFVFRDDVLCCGPFWMCSDKAYGERLQVGNERVLANVEINLSNSGDCEVNVG